MAICRFILTENMLFCPNSFFLLQVFHSEFKIPFSFVKFFILTTTLYTVCIHIRIFIFCKNIIYRLLHVWHLLIKVCKWINVFSIDCITYSLLSSFMPQLISDLLISVSGGAKSFNVPQDICASFQQGLLNAAKSTHAWIITGGQHCVSLHLPHGKLVGTRKCLGDY